MDRTLINKMYCKECGGLFGTHKLLCLTEYDEGLDLLTRNVFGISLEEALEQMNSLNNNNR